MFKVYPDIHMTLPSLFSGFKISKITKDLIQERPGLTRHPNQEPVKSKLHIHHFKTLNKKLSAFEHSDDHSENRPKLKLNFIMHPDNESDKKNFQH